MKIVRLEDQNLQASLRSLAQLREEVFREFPYLYEASETSERIHLQSYLKSSESLIIALQENETIFR